MLFSAHKIEHYWFPNRAIFPQDCKVERPTLRMMEPHLRKLWGNRWRHRWKCAALCDVIGSRPSCGRVRFCFDRGWRYDSAFKKKKPFVNFSPNCFFLTISSPSFFPAAFFSGWCPKKSGFRFRRIGLDKIPVGHVSELWTVYLKDTGLRPS